MYIHGIIIQFGIHKINICGVAISVWVCAYIFKGAYGVSSVLAHTHSLDETAF